MSFDKFGKLAVRTFTAGGALPLSGAIVRIRGAVEENSEVEYSLITDMDGLTEEIELPAPSALLSQAPNPSEPSYGVYDVEVSAADYYTKRIRNIAIFENTKTILPVNMIPREIVNNNTTYPHGNLNTTVRENEKLEM